MIVNGRSASIVNEGVLYTTDALFNGLVLCEDPFLTGIGTHTQMMKNNTGIAHDPRYKYNLLPDQGTVTTAASNPSANITGNKCTLKFILFSIFTHFSDIATLASGSKGFQLKSNNPCDVIATPILLAAKPMIIDNIMVETIFDDDNLGILCNKGMVINANTHTESIAK